MNSNQPLVEVTGLSKRFCSQQKRSMRYGLHDMLAELRLLRQPQDVHLRPDEFWAIRDLSFEIRPGQAWGVIGPNGAGKTTLLRMIHGLTKPDEGSVLVRGRTGALIALGAAFDPVLSGRENILSEAALLGVPVPEARNLVDEVIDFSGIGDFIEAPVGTYSQGMRMRLGYAIAAQLEPAVLLIDEVLAVGDIGFRRKCVAHIQRYLADGGSLVLVSHDMYLVQSLCEMCIVLEHGSAVFAGPTGDAVDLHLAQQMPAAPKYDAEPETGPQPVQIESIALEPTASDKELTTGEPADVTMTLDISAVTGPVRWGFSISTPGQEACIFSCMTGVTDAVELSEGSHELRAHVDRLRLVPGPYLLRGAVFPRDDDAPLAQAGWSTAPVTVRVAGHRSSKEALRRVARSLVTLEARWLRADPVDPVGETMASGSTE